jgi:hypothetical protein
MTLEGVPAKGGFFFKKEVILVGGPNCKGCAGISWDIKCYERNHSQTESFLTGPVRGTSPRAYGYPHRTLPRKGIRRYGHSFLDERDWGEECNEFSD